MATLNEMLDAAHAEIEKIDGNHARMLQDQGALLLDVRADAEIAMTGKAAGALHVARGLLEFKADPGSDMHDKAFRYDRPIVLFCASGGRAALAGMTLKQLGFQEVYTMGGFKDWVMAGGPMEDIEV